MLRSKVTSRLQRKPAQGINPGGNIAAHKRVVDALKASEERYRDLLETANDLIQNVSPDGSLLYVNRTWRETLGYDEEEITSLKLFDIIHPASQTHCLEAFQRALSGERAVKVKAVFVAKNGKGVPLEGSVGCRFKKGNPVATHGIFHDITEHIQLCHIQPP